MPVAGFGKFLSGPQKKKRSQHIFKLEHMFGSKIGSQWFQHLAKMRVRSHPPAETELPHPPQFEPKFGVRSIQNPHSFHPFEGGLFRKFFPSNQCKIALHLAPHQLSVGGWCGDYNANFSIVGRVVLLQPAPQRHVLLRGVKSADTIKNVFRI